MKKLMFAMMVAAGIVAISHADIASSNIVGYKTETLRSGASFTGATFVNVNGGDINIKDIVPTGTFDSGDIYIHVLDSYGRYTAEYTYCLENGFDDGCPAGWYDTEALVDISFPAGTGLAIYAPGNKAGITFAGQVPNADVTVTLRSGATYTLNPMPVNVDIQDLLPEGAFDSGDIYIHMLDGYGRYTEEYTYCLENGFDDGCPAGWYNTEALVEKEFEGGEGFAVYAPNNKSSITFPAPEL